MIFRDGFTLQLKLNGWSKIRAPVTAKFKHVTVIVTCTLLCCDDVTYVPAAVKFPKSWLGTLPLRQKIHHFFFSHTWGTRFKYLPEGCPYMLMYSALHIMQWFSHILDVFNPKIRFKFLDFNIFMNQNKRPIHKTWSDRLTYATSRVYHRRQTDLLLCTILLLPPLSSSSKHGRWRSNLLLYSISMVIYYLFKSDISWVHGVFL